MGAQGTTTVDFGAFPGTDRATVAVTGQTLIVAGSLVEAWLMPVATADHSADEHIMESPLVVAGNIVAATGFTIYSTGKPPPQIVSDNINSGLGPNVEAVNANKNNPYGLWTVAWVWN